MFMSSKATKSRTIIVIIIHIYSQKLVFKWLILSATQLHFLGGGIALLSWADWPFGDRQYVLHSLTTTSSERTIRHDFLEIREELFQHVGRVNICHLFFTCMGSEPNATDFLENNINMFPGCSLWSIHFIVITKII